MSSQRIDPAVQVRQRLAAAAEAARRAVDATLPQLTPVYRQLRIETTNPILRPLAPARGISRTARSPLQSARDRALTRGNRR